MRRARPLAALALLVAAPAAAEPMTLRQAVDAALGQSYQLRAAGEDVAAHEEKLAGTRALRFASVNADGNLFWWTQALKFNLDGFTLPPGADVIRAQVTSSLSVTLNQPLTALPVVGYYVGVDEHGLGAARAERDASRLDVIAHVAEGYLRALEARAGLEVAQKSLAQIEAQLERARILERGGTLGRVDVLRLETARDTARQAVLKTQAATVTSIRALALAIGVPPGTAIDVSDTLPDPPPARPWSEDDAVAHALRMRPELREAHEHVEQAEATRKIAFANYFPDVRGVATYQHTSGQGTFAPTNAWYVGLTMHWNVWDWGKTGDAVAEARHRRRQAEVGAAGLADQVAFEARKDAVDASTAFDLLAVTRSAVAAAEEAYRITSVRFQAGAATTTDVLDAETEVARARADAVVARYDYYISLVQLARAAGETPEFFR